MGACADLRSMIINSEHWLHRAESLRLLDPSDPPARSRWCTRSTEVEIDPFSATSRAYNHYCEAMKHIPTPTPEQIQNFVAHVCSSHSWYKHLPVQTGSWCDVWLSPTAGMRWTANGYVDALEEDKHHSHMHYSWKSTAEYRRSFGHLAAQVHKVWPVDSHKRRWATSKERERRAKYEKGKDKEYSQEQEDYKQQAPPVFGIGSCNQRVPPVFGWSRTGVTAMMDGLAIRGNHMHVLRNTYRHATRYVHISLTIPEQQSNNNPQRSLTLSTVLCVAATVPHPIISLKATNGPSYVTVDSSHRS